MIEPVPRAISLFYCYAREDAYLRDELEKHLETLRHEHLIQSWHAQEVLAGAIWKEVLVSHLRMAQIIVLLVSADFIASKDCYTEMMEALQRHESGEAVVLPLILREVDWKKAPFSHLHVLPVGGKPVTTWDNQDEAFTQITQGIRRIVEALQHPVMFVPSVAQEALSSILVNDLERCNIPLLKLNSSLKWQEEQIVACIIRTSMIILMVSPETENMRLLQRVGELARIYRRSVIVVKADEETGQEEISLPTMLSDALSVEVNSNNYGDMFKQILVHLRRRLSITPDTGSSEEPIEPRNPYKGLEAFGEKDELDFFGREKLRTVLTKKIAKLLESERLNQRLPPLLTLVGPSGSGKSSVVMAGLLPHLRKGVLPGSTQWIYLTRMVPDEDPLEKLALTLKEHFPKESVQQILNELSDDSLQGLYRLGQILTRQCATRAVLVIDQFEELFVPTVDEARRKLFLDVLLMTLTKARCPFIVILTLRADFSDRPMQYTAFYKLIDRSRCSIFPMNIDELRQAIERPAQLVQLIFEGDLVSELLLETLGQAGILPFLQFTLYSLYQNSDQRIISLDAYRKSGGIKGALTKQAEEVYNSLSSEEERNMARFVFLRLVNPGQANHDTTRRRARLAEFTFDDPIQNIRLQETIKIFVNAKLLTASAVAGKPTLEVSHEVLLYGWDRFKRWLKESPEDIQFQQRLNSDASSWEESQRSRDWLYRGERLRDAKGWARRNFPSGPEKALLRASTHDQRNQKLLRTSVLLLCLVLIGGVIKFWPVSPSFPGQSDANLNVSFIQIQAPAFMRPANLTSSNSGTLPDGTNPNDIAAQRIDTQSPVQYGVALNIRSLYQGDYKLLIEKVQMRIKKSITLPDPLHVFAQATSRYYSTNVFQALYAGNRPSLLDANYMYPGQHVQLRPDETDTLTIELSSLVRADLQFQVQITYVIGNDPQEHLLLFSDVFHAVFSDNKDWYPS